MCVNSCNYTKISFKLHRLHLRSPRMD